MKRCLRAAKKMVSTIKMRAMSAASRREVYCSQPAGQRDSERIAAGGCMKEAHEGSIND